jgi:hypothetical protein
VKNFSLVSPGYEAVTTTAHCSVHHLIDECAAVQAGDLATSHVRHLEVRVQQQVEAECEFLAGVVHPYVEVQLFLSQDQPVREAKPAITASITDVNLQVHLVHDRKFARIFTNVSLREHLIWY